MPDDTMTRSTGGTWAAPADDLALALRAPVVADLAELGVIEARGADAASFLHAQLTNDVVHLDTVRVERSGYCTAKGRLLATFDLWRTESAICLQLPREILAPLAKRVSMFVLRAQAKLEDASDRWSTFAVLGPGAGAALAAQFGTLPEAEQSVAAGAARLTRLPPAPSIAERYLLRCARADAAVWRERLGLPPVDAGVWWWSQIDAGLPTVFAATQEQFVPQMINYEVLGGVNFKKGCYPGQEVVARSQYLGKLRRRMGIAHVEVPAQAAADVYAVDQEQPVGRVVMAAAAPGGGSDLLFECPVERGTAAALSLGRRDGPPLRVRSLPYPLIDVTA
jgi:folate-binding protein YgfZ